MQIKKKIRKHPNIYLALFVCLVAVGIGTVTGFFATDPNADAEPEFTRVTVEWSEEIQPRITDNANIGISGIADERTETVTENTTEKTTENKPFSGSFTLPMGTDIIKDFSNGEMVESKTMGDWRVHNGVDFGGSAGNDVGAVAKGKITKVYDDVFWGTVVEIDHGNGMTAKYCGMKTGTCLPEGTQVEKGEKIGTLGHIPVEISDEDHLHLEITVDGKTVDPLKALNKVRG